MPAEHFSGTIGVRGGAELVVAPEHTAAYASGGGLPQVLSTPRVLQLVEDATYRLAGPYLADGYTSVGYQVVLEHIGPALVGSTVAAQVVLEAAEDRDLLFRFTVTERETDRTLARGTQTRRIVRLDEFMSRLKK